ncbi:MAG: chemotaxis response regulator protein-glutamate methylesterase [bacterium]|nr:chemotaxis response regulator protein-glutamate methylesterase [bacterium]
MTEKIKVHIVDDSALVRQVLSAVLTSDPGIEIMATSSDPIIAKKRLEKEWPDVFILDIEMPRMDGITFLKEIMKTKPTPVVMCSSLTEKNAQISMQAMSAGAVEVISKPKVGIKDFLTDSAVRLIDKVKSAAQADMTQLMPKDTGKAAPGAAQKKQRVLGEPKLNADAVISPWDGKTVSLDTDRIIAIGASAGGTHAIEAILKSLPAESPGIVIVQHMPEKFTKAFADRLNNLCAITVKEAESGDIIKPGCAIIGQGNIHLVIDRKDNNYCTRLKEGPLVSRHRPSVDVLFRSVAKSAGKNAIGVILTGMGDDGAAGLLEMHKAGAATIAQDKETCVVFGMPQEAIKRGAADKVLPLGDIPMAMMSE